MSYYRKGVEKTKDQEKSSELCSHVINIHNNFVLVGPKCPPPNLAISSHMAMTFGRGIIWVKSLQIDKVLMTSSSFRFYEVIIILMLKKWKIFEGFWQIIPCCHGNQFMRECWAKYHDQREEKWHFLKGAHGRYFGRMRTFCTVTNKVELLYSIS